jgi:hypothetical protein
LNPIAKDLIEGARAEPPSSSGNGNIPSDSKKQTSDSPLPRQIMRLHRYFKNVLTQDAPSVDPGMQDPCVIFLKNDSVCFARAIRLRRRPETSEEASLLIVIESASFHPDSQDRAFFPSDSPNRKPSPLFKPDPSPADHETEN